MYKLFLAVLIYFSLNFLNGQNQNLCGYSTNQKTYDGSDETKILGGKLSNPLDWPFVVSISGENGACTGTIIGEKWILSATHCKRMGTPMTVNVNGEKYESEKIVTTDWDVEINNNDIMLIKLKKPLKYSRRILPIF
uniref:Peptidase S1 domain-containing protein n=1 Tax=Panagrolaimus davidi TaxID=227884 RepID=A0A914P973_9BILA